MNMPLQNQALSSASQVLSAEQVEAFGKRIEAIRDSVLSNLNEKDAEYIYKIRNFVRYSEISSRALLMFGGWIPPVWLFASGLLGVSKIVENMELGHNVMHGQFDWLNDPSLNGQDYDWDNVCAKIDWQISHNFEHHTYTNIIGKDRDVGYGLLRLSDQQKWLPQNLLNIPFSILLALAFEWGVALYNLHLDEIPQGTRKLSTVKEDGKHFVAKAKRQLLKDYVFFPAIAGPMFLPVIAGNFSANIIRNVWAYAIIFCGHFTNNAEMFEDNLENETRAEWYIRQIKGSSNITGGKIMHILSGNLSHQIEHHLFPDMPANRYAEVAPQVKALCEEFGQNYNTGSFGRQLAETYYRIAIHSLPNNMASKVERVGQSLLKRFGLKRLINANA